MTLLKIKPSKVIGDGYLYRWHIIPRNKWFNIYLHKFIGSDDDRALHDHPWWSLSLRLKGVGKEAYLKNGDVVWRDSPRFALRSPTHAHRIALNAARTPLWTVFITGRVKREWGFICADGSWHHWTAFTTPQGGTIGGFGERWTAIHDPAFEDLDYTDYTPCQTLAVAKAHAVFADEINGQVEK